MKIVNRAETISLVSEREKNCHILLVEDDPIVCKILGPMFNRSKYSVDFAGDGLKAVKMWEAGDYDLVLMEIDLPFFDGFEATGAIREKERGCGCHTPIVAMTVRTLYRERCLAVGMDDFIPKPIDFKATLQLIGKILMKEPIVGLGEHNPTAEA